MTITLWPIVATLIVILFRKQIARILSDLGAIGFGSFSLQLRRRISKSTDPEQYARIRQLSSFDLKFFLAIASQSWRIERITWKMDTEESLRCHEKLEAAGLIKISERDPPVTSTLTQFGEEFYSELTSLIAESIR